MFSKSLAKLTFEDVVTFCGQGIKGNPILDYKSDFPTDLAKTISAFANTFGGTIIIGVNEIDGVPMLPFIGIPHSPGLEERVMQICVDSVFPPIAPEVVVCKNAEQRAFVVIRIQESEDTPHATNSNTRAYVRTGNISKPEDALSFEQLEWLMNRHHKSLSFRSELLDSAESHISNLVKFQKADFTLGVLTTFFSPIFPHRPIFPSPDFTALVDKFRTQNRRTARYFPAPDACLRPIKDGMYAYTHIERTHFTEYFEITRFGSIFAKTNLCLTHPHADTRDQIEMSRLLDLLHLAATFASRLYQAGDYWGSTHWQVSLTRLLGARFLPISNYVADELPPEKLQANLTFNKNLSPRDLRDTDFLKFVIAELAQEIAWAFGYSYSLDSLKETLVW